MRLSFIIFGPDGSLRAVFKQGDQLAFESSARVSVGVGASREETAQALRRLATAVEGLQTTQEFDAPQVPA